MVPLELRLLLALFRSRVRLATLLSTIPSFIGYSHTLCRLRRLLELVPDVCLFSFNVTFIRGAITERWIFLCLETVKGDGFSSLSPIVSDFGVDCVIAFVSVITMTGLVVISPGSVKTLSLDDSWLGGVGISVTTRPLLAKRHESVTSNGGRVCGVVGVCAGVVVGVAMLGRKASVVVTHGFVVAAGSLRHSGSTLSCASLASRIFGGCGACLLACPGIFSKLILIGSRIGSSRPS